MPLAVAAAFLYGLNVLLGVASYLRWPYATHLHGLHHLLYGLSFALAVPALAQALVLGSPQAPGLVIVVLALALFPKARGGSRRHLYLALLGLTGYAVSFSLLS
jgi:hypothetical protein